MTDLPQGWREVRLGEVADVLDSKRKPVNSKERAGRAGSVPYYGATGQVGTIDTHLFDEELVLLGEDGAPFFDLAKPKAYLISGKSWVNNHAHVLRCREGVYTNTLLVQFLNDLNYLPYVNGTTRLKLTQGSMNEIPVTVPPLAEQERIVEILEEQFSRLDSALASIKAVREKAKAFRRSLLHSAFSGELTGGTEGWMTVNIGSLLGNLPNGKRVGQGWSPQCESVPASEGEWGVLKTTAIQAGRFEPEHNKRLPATLEPREAIEIQVGDLLMTCAGPRVRCGVPCLVRKTPQKLMMSGKMYRFRPDTKQVVPEYLEAYLLAPTTQSAIDLLKTGISESGLNLTHARFFTLEVPKPPLAAQERIVSLLEEQFSRLDKALEVANQLEARIASERRSLLHAAFTGELTSQWRKTHV